MRQLAVIIWFLSNVAGGLTVRAQEIPVSTDTAAPAAAPELQAILADWVSRESRLRSGQFEWRVLRRIRSAKFGALSAADASVAQEETDPDFGEVGLQLERLLRTRFDASSFRLHGTSISAVPSAKPHSPSSIPASASVEGQFRAALAARFSLPISLEKPQPYMVQIDPQREVHFWAQDGAAPPLGLVLGAGQRSRYLDDHSSAALLTMLLDAMRFAVRPSIDAGGFAQKGGQDCRVLPQTAVVDGRRCLVIEEPHRNVRYWIDPSCGSVVVRHVLFGTDGAVRWQSDIDYDRNADGDWIPLKLNVLRMNSFGDPYDQISVIRESFALNVEPSQTLAWGQAAPDFGEVGLPLGSDFPPGTFVTDRVAGERYLVRADGTRRTITYRDTIAGIPYAELQSGRAPPAASPKPRSIRNFASQIVVKLLTWPGILVTLPTIYAMSLAARSGWRYQRCRGKSLPNGIKSEGI